MNQNRDNISSPHPLKKRKKAFQKKMVNNINAADRKRVMLTNKKPSTFSLFFSKLKWSQEHGPGGAEGDHNDQTGGNSLREELSPKDTAGAGEMSERTPNEASLVLSHPPLLPSSLVHVVASVWVLGPSL